ncbi:MAG: NADP-dependent isocitrate dehydrogenase, partial [bacterium]|nr:NADP-dependent isocitrate dehydrogenase [bacterium]
KYTRAEKAAEVRKATVGVDVFLEWNGGSPDDLGNRLEGASGNGVQLQMITNRGVKVYPGGMPETFCTDHWRCRFMADGSNATIGTAEIIGLLERLDGLGLECIKTENLCTFDGQLGYSLGQGQ